MRLPTIAFILLASVAIVTALFTVPERAPEEVNRLFNKSTYEGLNEGDLIN
jgi:hypothetical protein